MSTEKKQKIKVGQTLWLRLQDSRIYRCIVESVEGQSFIIVPYTEDGHVRPRRKMYHYNYNDESGPTTDLFWNYEDATRITLRHATWAVDRAKRRIEEATRAWNKATAQKNVLIIQLKRWESSQWNPQS